MKPNKIISRYYPSTYITAHHGGSGQMAWACAEAYYEGREDHAVTVDGGDMDAAQAQEKAVAILRARSR
jgi:hypothetical protein